MKKLSNTEAELKKIVAYKKSCSCFQYQQTVFKNKAQSHATVNEFVCIFFQS